MAVRKKASTTATAKVDDLILEDNAQQQLSSDSLERITSTAKLLQANLLAVEKLEVQLDEAKKEARKLREEVLPALMDEAGVTSIGLDDDTTLALSQRVFASISKANANAAAEWLDANGYGALVKAGFTIPLDKGDRALAAKVRAMLVKAHIGFNEESSVHPQTLTAFVKESLAEGRKLPDVITYHVQPVVDIKQPKKRK